MRTARSFYPWDSSGIRGLLEQNWFVGHPHGAGVAGARGRADDTDLYARLETQRVCGQEPRGPVLDLRLGPSEEGEW